jgi:hypothetical protein
MRLFLYIAIALVYFVVAGYFAITMEPPVP